MKRRESNLLKMISVYIPTCFSISVLFSYDVLALSNNPGMLSEIVVTAQRRDERLQDIPLSLTVQTGDQLEKSAVFAVRDLPNIVPGLTFSSGGPIAQPTIRGITSENTQPGADSAVALYIDGFYQQNQVANDFDLPDVERIEVLKGPQGTLFGRNATGGAILIHTKQPSFIPEGAISISDGVYHGSGVRTSHEVSTSVYFSGPLVQDILAGSITTFYKEHDGYLTDIVRNDNRVGKESSGLVRTKLLYTPNDRTSFTLGVSASKSKSDAMNSQTVANGLTIASQYPDAIIPTKPWQVASENKDSVVFVETEHKDITLKGEFEIGDLGVLTSLTGYVEVDGEYNQDIDGAYSPACLAVNQCLSPYYVVYGPSEGFQQEFSFASNQIGDFSFILGGMYYKNEHNFEQIINPALTPDGKIIGSSSGILSSETSVDTEAYAGFGEVTWDVSEKITIIGGLRYSWEEKDATASIFNGPKFDLGGSPSWDSWTSRLSVTYDMSERESFYFTYSEGFKSGLIDSISISGQVADPEEVKAYEIGYKSNSDKYMLTAAAFYYDYTDLQVQVFDGAITHLRNAASAEMYGLDFDTTLLLGSKFKARFAASWMPTAEYKKFVDAPAYSLPMTPEGMEQISVDASGKRKTRSPKLTGNITLEYQDEIPFGLLDASITYYYSSDYKWDIMGDLKSDSYDTLSARISLSPFDSNFNFSIWGRNLTNEAYFINTTPGGHGHAVVYERPRQIGFTAKYTF